MPRKHIPECLFLVPVLLVTFASAIAQAPLKADDAEAQTHLLKHVDPIYPPIAEAARVQGEVLLQIEINQAGKVTQVKPISGPPMLIMSATYAAKQWQYKPFEINGAPVNATAKIKVQFNLDTPPDPGDRAIADIYFPLSTKCHELVNQRAAPEEQANICQKAADQADLFSKTSRFIERRSAYVYLSTALIRDKRPKEAVLIGEKAVAVVLQGHDDGSGSSAAYSARGQAKAMSGDLGGADKDFETAENYQRKALDTPAGHELSKSYSQTLKSLLSFHAQVLTALNEQARAQAKLDEAAKL